jgi:hypothetical protein
MLLVIWTVEIFLRVQYSVNLIAEDPATCLHPSIFSFLGLIWAEKNTSINFFFFVRILFSKLTKSIIKGLGIPPLIYRNLTSKTSSLSSSSINHCTGSIIRLILINHVSRGIGCKITEISDVMI